MCSVGYSNPFPYPRYIVPQTLLRCAICMAIFFPVTRDRLNIDLLTGEADSFNSLMSLATFVYAMIYRSQEESVDCSEMLYLPSCQILDRPYGLGLELEKGSSDIGLPKIPRVM